MQLGSLLAPCPWCRASDKQLGGNLPAARRAARSAAAACQAAAHGPALLGLTATCWMAPQGTEMSALGVLTIRQSLNSASCCLPLRQAGREHGPPGVDITRAGRAARPEQLCSSSNEQGPNAARAAPGAEEHEAVNDAQRAVHGCPLRRAGWSRSGSGCCFRPVGGRCRRRCRQAHRSCALVHAIRDQPWDGPSSHAGPLQRLHQGGAAPTGLDGVS